MSRRGKPATLSIDTVKDLGVACFLIAFLSMVSASPEPAQLRQIQSGSVQEPITPIPTTPALDLRRAGLGEQLFADRRLSHDDKRSCQSCHDTETNGATSNAHDTSRDGNPLKLNTPTIFNVGLNYLIDWEGDLRSLERQAEQVLQNPEIMASSVDEVLSKLRADPEMVRRFGAAYGKEPDRSALLDAIAAFERSLVTPSRFDRFLAGDRNAITPEELSGYRLFKSLGCVACHQGVNVGGNLFQRHGIFHPLGSPDPQVLRVPSLRNVATTAPYFHDGSAPTLPDAVRAMGFAQLDRALTDQQIAAIVAFLNTLTGTYRGHAVSAASGASREGLQ